MISLAPLQSSEPLDEIFLLLEEPKFEIKDFLSGRFYFPVESRGLKLRGANVLKKKKKGKEGVEWVGSGWNLKHTQQRAAADSEAGGCGR